MSDSSTAPPLSPGLNVKLSTMMFLQYAIWGAWLPFLWSFLQVHRELEGGEIGTVFAVGAVGAIVGPLIAGPIADKFLNTEYVLAISHLAGAALIWQLATIETYEGVRNFALLYGLIYMPTLSLTNSLAFHHLPDRDRDFSRVRIWGTIGWIVVGLAMGHWLRIHYLVEGDARVAELARGKADAFKLSAILGVLMGLYCLLLPKTPPTRNAESNPAVRALGAAARQPLLALFAISLVVSCVHQFYFVHTEAFVTNQATLPGWTEKVFGAGGGGWMTVGQMSEVAVLAAIPLLSRSLSRKALLGIGLLAYAGRMALFAYADQLPIPLTAVLLLGIALHGVCFGCFVFVAFMIVDEECSPEIRASAQNLYNLVMVGIGIILGSKVAGWVAEWASHPTGELDADGEVLTALDYTQLFSAPMYAAIACLFALLVFYPGGRRTQTAQ